MKIDNSAFYGCPLDNEKIVYCCYYNGEPCCAFPKNSEFANFVEARTHIQDFIGIYWPLSCWGKVRISGADFEIRRELRNK